VLRRAIKRACSGSAMATQTLCALDVGRTSHQTRIARPTAATPERRTAPIAVFINVVSMDHRAPVRRDKPEKLERKVDDLERVPAILLMRAFMSARVGYVCLPTLSRPLLDPTNVEPVGGKATSHVSIVLAFRVQSSQKQSVLLAFGTFAFSSALSDMPRTDEKSRARAEAMFKVRQQQRADAPIAVGEYRQTEQAARDQLRRLRQARLAREAKEQ